jgi:hypothetical protein
VQRQPGEFVVEIVRGLAQIVAPSGSAISMTF